MENNNKVCRVTYIYGLYEIGKEDIIRYVGKSNDPHNRLKTHIKNVDYCLKKGKRLTYKQNWIIKVDYNIGVKVLEICSIDKWQEREMYHISIRENLTNSTIGGECGRDYKYKISYNECKEIIKKYNIKSSSKWRNFTKNKSFPNNIPKNPRVVYLNRGWVSWGDFLGTGRIQDNMLVDYISYGEAKNIISKMGYNNLEEYKSDAKLGKIPNNIPNRPNRYYKNRGWVSWGDFLGTGRIANQLREFVSYDECKKFAKDNNIKTVTKWRKINKPNNIPRLPETHYENFSWSDLLGVEIISDNEKNKKYLKYQECVDYIKDMGFKSLTQYRKYVSENDIDFLPMNPDNTFRNKGYVSSKLYLSIFDIEYLDLNDAKNKVIELGLKSVKEWRDWVNKNDINDIKIPRNPDNYYKNKGWISWYDFLGK